MLCQHHCIRVSLYVCSVQMQRRQLRLQGCFEELNQAYLLHINVASIHYYASLNAQPSRMYIRLCRLCKVCRSQTTNFIKLTDLLGQLVAR